MCHALSNGNSTFMLEMQGSTSLTTISYLDQKKIPTTVRLMWNSAIVFVLFKDHPLSHVDTLKSLRNEKLTNTGSFDGRYRSQTGEFNSARRP